MTQYVSYVLAFAFMLAPVFALAQSDVEEQLRARIAELEEKVEELQELAHTWQARAEALSAGQQAPTASEALQEKRLARLLSVGMTGDDVRALQEALAKEPGVYPEGLVTGYYGPLTEAALARLKARHGVAEESTFGPQTLAFLNQWLRGEGVAKPTPPGQVISQQAREGRMNPEVEALLKQIREGKRGEDLRKNVGQRGKDGKDGEDGKDGQDGADGEDA